MSEEGQWCRTEVGTAQGPVISSRRANEFPHSVLDLWVNRWRKTNDDGAPRAGFGFESRDRDKELALIRNDSGFK